MRQEEWNNDEKYCKKNKEETWFIKNQLTNRKDTDRMKLTGSEEAMAEML